MNYINFNKKESLDDSSAGDEEENAADTRKMPLDELPSVQQLERALAVVAERHPNIAKTLDSFWGFHEGEDYLKKLIFDGFDPKSHTREGFRADVFEALLALQSLHVVTKR